MEKIFFINILPQCVFLIVWPLCHKKLPRLNGLFLILKASGSLKDLDNTNYE